MIQELMNKHCPKCKGHCTIGMWDEDICDYCNGTGVVIVPYDPDDNE